MSNSLEQSAAFIEYGKEKPICDADAGKGLQVPNTIFSWSKFQNLYTYLPKQMAFMQNE